MKTNKRKTKSGYAIVELLFYIAFFAVLVSVVINSMITMTRSFRETAIQGELAQSGAIMERISREIRQAADISSISNSSLQLYVLDPYSMEEKTVEFSFADGDVIFAENDIPVGSLNAPNITVVAMTFTEIITEEGKAVKVALSVQSDNDLVGRTVDFYNTIVLRGIYDIN